MKAPCIRLTKNAKSIYLLKTQISLKAISQLKWKGLERDMPWKNSTCVRSRQDRRYYTSAGTLHTSEQELRRSTTSMHGNTTGELLSA